jgi:purine-nucleoside phosphorylase
LSIHINAAHGGIARRILLPGDPLRARYIAQNYLESPVCFNEVRGMLGYTGIYGDGEVSVMGTGMGIPSISIYITELMRDYGVEELVRIGTCGSLREDVKVRDVVMAQAACTDSGFLRRIFPGDFAPAADFGLMIRAHALAEARGLKLKVGSVFSSDMFYGEELAGGGELWAKYGLLAVEMETAALYTLAQKYSARALALLTVSDSPDSGEADLSAKERERALGDMIRLALDILRGGPREQ